MLRHGAWLLIPLQALLLQAPAVLAETSQTKFELQLPLSPICRALSRDCMTPSQWARFCRKHALLPSPLGWFPKGCHDVLEGSEIVEKTEPEPPIRFLPEDHTGPVCMALLPACMTRSQWAQVCEGWRAEDPDYEFPRSCLEALDIKETEGAAEVAE